MTREELINLGQNVVRNNEAYLLEYIRIYESLFGYKPSCGGCSVNNDWNKFKNAKTNISNIENNVNMEQQKEDRKYILKKIYYSTILSYKKHENGRSYYVYGRLMTDTFAENYLKYGTPEQIAERELQFDYIYKEPELEEIDDPADSINEAEAGTEAGTEVKKRGRKPKQ